MSGFFYLSESICKYESFDSADFLIMIFKDLLVIKKKNLRKDSKIFFLRKIGGIRQKCTQKHLS